MIGHAADAGVIYFSRRPFEGEHDFQGVLKKIGRLIEEGVTESSPDEKPENGPDKVVLDQFNGKGQAFRPDPVLNEGVRGEKGQEVHEAVIPQLKRPELDNDGIDMGREMLPETDERFHASGLSFLEVSPAAGRRFRLSSGGTGGGGAGSAGRPSRRGLHTGG